MEEISAIKPKKSAGLLPNAIEITDRASKTVKKHQSIKLFYFNHVHLVFF